MHYELNVSLNGAHLFATAERSATSEAAVLRLFRLFREKFPEAAGYTVTATLRQTGGRNVTAALIAKLDL